TCIESPETVFRVNCGTKVRSRSGITGKVVLLGRFRTLITTRQTVTTDSTGRKAPRHRRFQSHNRNRKTDDEGGTRARNAKDCAHGKTPGRKSALCRRPGDPAAGDI